MDCDLGALCFFIPGCDEECLSHFVSKETISDIHDLREERCIVTHLSVPGWLASEQGGLAKEP